MNKKGIISIVVAFIICLPCLLIVDAGPEAPNGVEKLGITNLIGFAWLVFLVLGGFKLITPKWMRDELKSYMVEED